MEYFDEKVVIGNVVIYPNALRNFLKKSHYWLTYDTKEEKIVLSANHGYGGKVIMEIRNASHENAEKFATLLGLSSDSKAPLHWSKWNPIFNFYHNGSKEADKIYDALIKSGIPFIYKGAFSALMFNDDQWTFNDGQCNYEPPLWTADKVIEIIKENAERFKKELTTKP